MASFNILQENSYGMNYTSYLNQSDTNLYLGPSINEFFFGTGDVSKDSIEMGIYDSSQNLLYFTSITGSYTTTRNNYLYTDIDGNSFVDYFDKTTGNFIQRSDRSLLIDIPDFISSSISNSSSLSSSLFTGASNNFYISVNPIINFFSISNPLVIKEISNSKQEIRLVKNFLSENVENDISLEFKNSQIYLNGNTSINLKSGIIHTITVSVSGNEDITDIGFSLVKDGPILGTGTNYTSNIIFKPLTQEIILDTTSGNFPQVLWIYNKHQSGMGCQITFADSVDKDIFKLNTEFLSLDSNKFVYEQIYDIMEYYLNSFNCVNLYNSTKNNNVAEIESLKHFFTLNSDSGVYDILNTIFHGEAYYDNLQRKQVTIPGILNYILNYMNFNYNLVGDFQTLSSQINRINVYTIDEVLRHKNPNYTENSQTLSYYNDSITYLSNLFNYFLLGVQASVNSDFTEVFKSPIRNALNFGSNNYSLIINSKINYSDQNNLEYVVKLKDPLPDQYGIGSACNVSNITYIPFFQRINFISPSPISRAIKLNSTNFNIQINDLQPSISTKTKEYSYSDLSVPSPQKQDIQNVKTSTQFNVDFSDFSNFVVFSQAFLRVKIFENKIITLTLLDQEAQVLKQQAKNGQYPSTFTQHDGYNNIITLGPYTSGSQQSDQINSILESFDPYESYLYNQYTSGSCIYDIPHKMFIDPAQSGSKNPQTSPYISELESSAYEYDRINRDSLYNNTPEFINADDNNSDYLKFLSMVGHHFDNIYLYISTMNVYTQIGNDLDNGIPRTLLSSVLESFGMKLPPTLSGNTDGSDVLSTYLTDIQTPGTLNGMSLDDKTKVVWKRILTNLPQIYKTKGTNESITYILNCYGIPENLITIKEFGGGYTSPGIDSWNDVAEKEYLLQFVGNNNEYVRIDGAGGYMSLDFKFSVSDKDYSPGNLVELYSKFGNNMSQTVSFGIIKGTDVNGMYYIIIRDPISGSEYGYVTDPIPLFDGNITSVMLRKNHVNPEFENSCFPVDAIPVQYDIVSARNNTIRDTSSIKEFSFYLSGSVNTVFRSNNINMFGNSYPIPALVYFSSEDVLNLLSSELDPNDIFGPEMQEIQYGINYSGSWNNPYDPNQKSIFKLNFIGTLDKFTFNLNPINNDEFYTKCINLNSYTTRHPSSSYFDTLFRFDLGFPIDISVSSSAVSGGYSVQNSNPEYSNITASAFNFIGVNYSSSFNTSSCVSQSVSVFPYQTQKFDIINQYYTSEVGPNRFENEKINKKSIVSPENRLSPANALFYKDSINDTKDSNKLGIFVAPVEERNSDILNFFGNHKIISAIATPYDTLSNDTSYTALKNLRREYYGTHKQRILFNELFIMYQTYIDKSVFQTLINVIPGRNKVYSGILIEPSILERNRIHSRVGTHTITTLSANIEIGEKIVSDSDDAGKYFIATENVGGIIPINEENKNVSYSDNNWMGLGEYVDVPDPFQLNVYCESGSGLVYYTDGKVYQAYILYKNDSLYYANDSDTLISTYKKRSQKMVLFPAIYNFILEESDPIIESESENDLSIENTYFSSSVYQISHSIVGLLVPFTSSCYYNNLMSRDIFTRKKCYYTSSGSISTNHSPTWFVKSRQTSQTTISDPDNTNNGDVAPIIYRIVTGPVKAGGITNPNILNK